MVVRNSHEDIDSTGSGIESCLKGQRRRRPYMDYHRKTVIDLLWKTEETSFGLESCCYYYCSQMPPKQSMACSRKEGHPVCSRKEGHPAWRQAMLRRLGIRDLTIWWWLPAATTFSSVYFYSAGDVTLGPVHRYISGDQSWPTLDDESTLREGFVSSRVNIIGGLSSPSPDSS